MFLRDIEKKNTKLKLAYHENFWFGIENGVDYFQLEPDFLLKEITDDKFNKTVAVLDTKFKYPFNDKNVAAIKDSDLYQLTTYASAFKTRHIFLIYPVFKNSPVTGSCIATYQLKTNFIESKLILLQVDITEPCLEKIQDELNKSILLSLDK